MLTTSAINICWGDDDESESELATYVHWDGQGDVIEQGVAAGLLSTTTSQDDLQGYMGEDEGAGWYFFDGEFFCSRDCVDGWELSQPNSRAAAVLAAWPI